VPRSRQCEVAQPQTDRRWIDAEGLSARLDNDQEVVFVEPQERSIADHREEELGAFDVSAAAKSAE
jgi:hypothetical protein